MGFFDFLTGKNRIKIYDAQNGRAAWEAARAKLTAAGIKIHSGYYDKEGPICGWCSHLDVRDFGPKGKIDRKSYYIRVALDDVAKAKEILAAK